MLAYGIELDYDILPDKPITELEIPDSMWSAESSEISAYISNTTGFCNRGFKLKLTEYEQRVMYESTYNEGTEEEICFYLNPKHMSVGDRAFILEDTDTWSDVEIVHIICESDDLDAYSKLIEDDNVLVDGEAKYRADTSAEFITDDNCYLVWFSYRW